MKGFVLSLALALAPGQLFAQSPALIGAWSVTLAVGARKENGVETPIMQDGTLKITAEGDSLVAIMTMQLPAGMPPRPPARMAAARASTPAVFVLKSQADINVNGEEMTRSVIRTFTLAASGNSLTGTMTRVIEGVDLSSTPLPVTGTRATP